MPHGRRRVKLALDPAATAVSGTKGGLTARNIPPLPPPPPPPLLAFWKPVHLSVLDLINVTVPEVLAYRRAPLIGQLIQNITA